MDSVTGVTQASGVQQSGTQTTSAAADQKMNFLNLLITQMQNQDPLDPMDNNQMVSQLAQMTQVQNLETMNSTLKDALSANQGAYAASLIGKTITFVPDGETTAQSGQVTGVQVVDGETRLIAGTQSVSLSSIRTISGSV